jgi:hypothetical protein
VVFFVFVRAVRFVESRLVGKPWDCGLWTVDKCDVGHHHHNYLMQCSSS